MKDCQSPDDYVSVLFCPKLPKGRDSTKVGITNRLLNWPHAKV